jgi:uncharacterized repeat protein (TIGR02543 family)
MKTHKVGSQYIFSLLLIMGVFVSCPAILVDPSAYRYSLSFSGNGNDSGEVPSASVQPFEAVVTAPIPGTDFLKSGHMFRGWNSSDDGSGTGYAAGALFSMPAHDLTLYAVWEPVTEADRYFTLSYNPNKGVGSMPSRTLPDGSVVVLDPNQYSMPDHYFAGWSDEPTGPVLYDNNASYLIAGANAVLYARWEPMYNNGEMLVRSGPYLFRIGGRDGQGNLRSQVLRATIGAGGTVSSWSQLMPLPMPLADGAAIAAGNWLYLLGGISSAGPSKSILAISLSATGDYTYASGWDVYTQSLPEPRANATAVLHDGRIFLIGGSDGIVEYSDIIHARIYQDGQVGQWYESPINLPFPLMNSAAVSLGSKLFIAGGSSGGFPVDLGVRYSIGTYGLLTDPQPIPLPEARTRGVLTADGTSLVYQGGFTSVSADFQSFRLQDAINGVEWIHQPVHSPGRILGPGYTKAYGRLFGLDGTGNLIATELAGGSLMPDLPSYFPGSGLVPFPFYIRWESEPGVGMVLNGVPVQGTSLKVFQPATLEFAAGTSMYLSHPEGRTSSSYAQNPYPMQFMISVYRYYWSDLLKGVELNIPEGKDTVLVEVYVPQTSTVYLMSTILQTVYPVEASLDVFEKDLFTMVLGQEGEPLADHPVGVHSMETRTETFTLGTGSYYYFGVKFDQKLQEGIKLRIKLYPEFAQ